MWRGPFARSQPKRASLGCSDPGVIHYGSAINTSLAAAK